MKRKDKKDTDCIEDLLKRAQEGTLSDDFEREAAEGFNMAGHDEAAQAKRNVDDRMGALLQERKKPVLIYWSMAAGLLLVIALSVLFLREGVTLEGERQLSHAETQASVEPPPDVPPAPKKEPEIQTGAIAAGKMKAVQDARSSEHKDPTTLNSMEEAAASPEPAPSKADAVVAADELPEETVLPSEDAKQEKTEPPDSAPQQPALAFTGEKRKKQTEPVPAARENDARTAFDMSRAGAEPKPDVSRIGTCIAKSMREKHAEELSKKFEATVFIRDGAITDVKFSRDDDLTRKEQKRFGDLIRQYSGRCLTGAAKQLEIPVKNEP